MNAQEIRRRYLRYFEERDHVVIPRAALVLRDDPTTLFTGSGMQPLLPYLLGQEHPDGTRLADSQTCLRAQDIDEVGDNRHTTFFEMLGNWSLGDYFKQEQLPWFFEFLVDVVGLDPNKLYVSCFIGDSTYNLPKDTHSAEVWQRLFKDRGIDATQVDLGSEADGGRIGMEGGRIFFYDGSKNWWSRNGSPEATQHGEPCGPDSEVFYEFTELEHDQAYGEHCHPNCECGRFMEIGNSVFMQYRCTSAANGNFVDLPKQNVDFGGGLERIAAAAIDSPDVFRISLIWPIIEKLQKVSGKQYEDHTESMRVIADHLRAATFLAVDGCIPSNKEQGYVMRRLIRRAVRFAFELGVEQNFLQEIVPVIADLYHDDYPEVAQKRDEVIAVLAKEEKAFRQTLRNGLKQFKKMALGNPLAQTTAIDGVVIEQERHADTIYISGENLFTLYDTYGFPVELSVEEAQKQSLELSKKWREEFDAKMQQQRERSQTAAKGTFKGGLGGQELTHKKYHTATHLMYQALRDVLGDHVVQHGSNITEERLRFDFSHPEKVTREQLDEVERIVNEQIEKDLNVTWEEHPTDYARNELKVIGAFGDRYGETVKCYRMQADGEDEPYSFEICGGPHVDHTLQLFEDNKRFKITKEESSSAGIRRIKAVLA